MMHGQRNIKLNWIVKNSHNNFSIFEVIKYERTSMAKASTLIANMTVKNC